MNGEQRRQLPQESPVDVNKELLVSSRSARDAEMPPGRKENTTNDCKNRFYDGTRDPSGGHIEWEVGSEGSRRGRDSESGG